MVVAYQVCRKLSYGGAVSSAKIRHTKEEEQVGTIQLWEAEQMTLQNRTRIRQWTANESTT